MTRPFTYLRTEPGRCWHILGNADIPMRLYDRRFSRCGRTLYVTRLSEACGGGTTPEPVCRTCQRVAAGSRP